MKVKDYIQDAQNGTNLIINERVFYEDNDDITDVFTGTVGKIGKCPYMDRNVDYFRILGGALELNISRIKGE